MGSLVKKNMKLLLLTIIIVGFCVFALSFNIIFRKNGKFPDGVIAHNKELRKRGIQCAKVEEKILWGKKGRINKRDNGCGINTDNDACTSCMGDCADIDKEN